MRTRPAYTEAELKEVYESPWEYDSDWSDHDLRREDSLSLLSNLIEGSQTAADLSCGDAYFAKKLPGLKWYLGDYAPGYQFTGPIEETIDQIPPVDLFLLCETLEHLDNPSLVLSKIRAKTHRLLLSTPLMTQRDENPQHYWAWDQDAVLGLLTGAGFTVRQFTTTKPDVGYVFQIWSLA